MKKCSVAIFAFSMIAAVAPFAHRAIAAPEEADPALEEEYNTKAKAADSFSADDQYNLALWCEEKGMTARFEEHLFNAYLLNAEHAGTNTKLNSLLKQKEEKLAAADANAHFELGEWCAKAGLKDDARRFYEKAVAIDPDHADARAKLGYVKLGDKWVTVEEASKLTGTSEAAVRAIGKALEIEFKLPFTYKAAGPYMIYLQHESKPSEYKMGPYADACNSFYEGIKEKFGDVLGLPPKDRVITVAVIEKGEALCDYLKRKEEPKEMSIYYDRETKRLLMRTMNDAKDILRCIAHEGSHQFYYEAMKDNTAKTSLWVQEGISCFIEAFKRKPDTKFEFGTMNEGLIYKAKTLVKEKKNIPLAEFVEIKYEDWARELKRLFLKRESGEIVIDDEPQKALERKRQQAWSIFYFLYHGQDGKYRSKLLDYLKLETSTGKSGLDAFKQVFGDPAQIEKEWLEYVPTTTAMD